MPRGRKKTEVAPQDLLNEVLTSIEETEQKLKTLKSAVTVEAFTVTALFYQYCSAAYPKSPGMAEKTNQH